jgi:phospho-N-acetylmuramoyl-pentapeptide-transferase
MSDLPIIAAAAIALLITAVMGVWLIPFLRKIKAGQTILDIGPVWHKKKEGTPTMGGLMFAAGITAAVLVGYFMLKGRADAPLYGLLDDVRMLLGLVMALAFGFIGFIDDYIKVVKKRNLGLSAPQKMVMQFGVGIIYLAGLWLAGDTSTIVFIPFLGQLDMGVIYYPLALLGIVYLVNVVNLTDGLDGLCSSVTFVVALGMLASAMILRADGMRVMAAALAGGCVGFLVWNVHPAKVFMGDTGSMFLGGMVVALAFGIGIPIFLIFLGIIYIMVGLSVLIQTTYFKLTRRLTVTPKRLFKMSPIQHHFELSGWSENKIVTVFSLVQVVFCVVAVLAVLRI